MTTRLSLINEYVNPLSYRPDFEAKDIKSIEGVKMFLNNLFGFRVNFNGGGGRKLFLDTYQEAYNLYSTFLK
jgi:hypothetical protein